MASYHIRDFEALSGIKAHTIRIWEQRYGLLKPTRTDTNIRQYSDDELLMLLNISLLNRNGFKISQLAKMQRSEMEEQVRIITSSNFEHVNQVDALTMAMVELDEAAFDRIININIAQAGFESTMEMVVFPFLQKIGIMWQTGSVNPAQEHFISNLVRQKLIAAIDRLQLEKEKLISKSLLFLPEGELHELGLLFLNYLLRKNNHHVLYLGQNVPFRDIEKVVTLFRPNQLFSVFTSCPVPMQLSAYVSKLSKLLPKGRIYLSGNLLLRQKIKLPANVELIREWAAIKSVISA